MSWVLGGLESFADGSRDLYPSGIVGRRALLYTGSNIPQSWPFPNEGVHYVYAKVGERITMASSAQNNGGSSRIRLFGPNGAVLVNDNTNAGKINNRAEVLIFNRWGNEVYRNDNYRNDWAGLNLNDGVYYYMISAHESGSRTVHRGWVVLKRD